MARVRVYGNFCPDCGRAHDRGGEVLDDTAYNIQCRNCQGDLPTRPMD